MREGDKLYSLRQAQLVDRSGELQRLQQLNPFVDRVVARVMEADYHVPTPGIEHVRTALRRVVGDIPTGKAFASEFYDVTDSVVSDYTGINDLETAVTRQPMRSRVFVIADNDRGGGKVGKKLEEWLDGKKEAPSKVIIHTVTPGGAISFDVGSITFVAVQVKGGGTYCFEIVPNDNKGKIIATDAIQNEFGDIRERFGYIDNCPVKAIELSPINRGLVEDELKRMIEELPEPDKPENVSKVRSVYEKLGATGRKLSNTIGKQGSKAKVNSTSIPLDNK